MSADNFFTDNPDLSFRLQKTDLQEVVRIKEKNYSFHTAYLTAPRNYADAMENYRLMLEVLGDICANVVAPAAAQADEQGALFNHGQVNLCGRYR